MLKDLNAGQIWKLFNIFQIGFLHNHIQTKEKFYNTKW